MKDAGTNESVKHKGEKLYEAIIETKPVSEMLLMMFRSAARERRKNDTARNAENSRY